MRNTSVRMTIGPGTWMRAETDAGMRDGMQIILGRWGSQWGWGMRELTWVGMKMR